MAKDLLMLIGQKRGSSSGGSRNPIAEALEDEEDPMEGADEEESDDSMLETAARSVRKAVTSGNDAALAKALKNFYSLCKPAPKFGR